MNQSTDERIKSTTERVENMSQKIEDINQKENIQSATVQVFLEIFYKPVTISIKLGLFHFRTLILESGKLRSQRSKYLHI